MQPDYSGFREGFAQHQGIDVHEWLSDFVIINEQTQAALARELGIDSSVVNLWANGKRRVQPYRLPALAAALTKLTGHDVSEEDIVRWSDDGLVPTDWRDAAGTKARPITQPLSGLMFLPPQPVPEPVAAVEAPVPVGPSEYPLLWCTKTHGAGGEPRRHHHGPRSAWADGPVVTDIDDFARGPAYQPPEPIDTVRFALGPAYQPPPDSEAGRHHLGHIALRIACTCNTGTAARGA